MPEGREWAILATAAKAACRITLELNGMIERSESMSGAGEAGANLSDLLGVKKQEKRTVFFTMVMHPLKGWTRVGNAYPTRKLAGEWVPFVRGAWKGLRVKVSQCTVYLENGKVSEKSRRLLDTKYNLDIESVKLDEVEQ